MKKIETVSYDLNAVRGSKFDKVWAKSNKDVEKHSVKGPKLPRQRKIPRRL